ncbi:GNAT family N-acetyltransferase [Streptomyces sp. NRRL F-5126]|uniref:GNAT family N-acetyltransferase n=1 Tax=Streptomyces sp. NRRL F-5126 TaxID=1463857 RepID=UPI0004C518D5|nr:GNAT family N-acetyltransferase [Streptomyces sp. NRRL F-5126]
MDFTIRPAEPDEYARIGELTTAAYVGDGLLAADDPYVERLRDVGPRARQARVLAAVDGEGALLGTVAYVGEGGLFAEVARAGEAEFRMLAVEPDARGRGVGEALVRACLARAREQGHGGVALSTQQTMAAAHRLYERLGFRRDASRDWSPVPGVDLLVYALTF